MNEVNDVAFAIIIICGILLLIVVIGLLCLVMSLSFDCWWNIGYCSSEESDEEECFLSDTDPVPKHWLVVFSRKKKNGPSHKSVVVPI